MRIRHRRLHTSGRDISPASGPDERFRSALIAAGRRALINSDGWQEDNAESPALPLDATVTPRPRRRQRPSRPSPRAELASPPGPVAYRAAKAALGPALRFAYRVDVEGLENVPSDEGVILAANHRSFMDSIFLALATPQPVAFVAKAEYFERPATRWIFNATGQIPLHRGSPSAARNALAAATDVLAKGGTVGIYPEGTRSRDGKLHRGNLGPARLAAATDAAIVPVGLIGTDQVQLPEERLPHLFRHVTVRFGSPVRVGAAPEAKQLARLRAVTDGLMADIASLSGAEYDDHFA
ncbi:MAG: lysophospholipid acyltransferase family protein [Acidimicrobiales bacterium]